MDSHYHEGLAQLFFFADKDVLGRLDFEEVHIQAPALIWMPQLASHGFEYPEDTCGWVITVPSVDLARLSRTMPWIETWLPCPAAIFGDDHGEALYSLRPLFEEIETEHVLWGEERSVILEALFRTVLIRVQRILRKERSRDRATRISHLALVNEFEALVDRDHLRNRSVSDYAAELSVTSTYLTRCVKAIAVARAVDNGAPFCADPSSLEVQQKPKSPAPECTGNAGGA